MKKRKDSRPQVRAFHMMAKPRGAICNLDCRYCYFLAKEELYPGSDFHMSDSLLEEYTRLYIEAQQVPEVTFSWQGGEPTLMGLPFFRKAVAYQQQYQKPGMRIYNALQTNGIVLDDAWGAFLHEHRFLVGLSLDGPRALHDRYRVDKGGQPTFDNVMRGLEYLKKHRVEFNILTTVNASNAEHPLEVYRFLRDDARAPFIQFIPIVEKTGEAGGCSVTAQQYGDFLITVFDEWVRRDVGRTFVQIFDSALAAWTGHRPGLCIFEETCGTALVVEHNGDVYSCDHFVEPAFKLGSIAATPLADLVDSEQQRRFGHAKRDTLPRYCLECEVKFVCHGGCPKDRIIHTPGGEAGLNFLCQGYRAFFNHIDRPMRIMAHELAHRRPPANVMRIIQRG